MLYFLKQIFNVHESHIHSFLLISTLSAITIQTFDRFSRANGFITLSPLTLTSFKAMGITLKYARFLKIGNVALY